MEVYITEQLIAALYSVALGAFFGVVYDILKYIRHFFHATLTINALKDKLNSIKSRLNKSAICKNKVKTSTKYKIEMFFWDILFFIIIIPISQIFVYATSFGIVRWYILFGMGIGFVMYSVIIAKITKFIFDPIVFALLVLMEAIKTPIKKAKIHIKSNRLKRIKNKKALRAKSKQNKAIINERQSLISVGKKL